MVRENFVSKILDEEKSPKQIFSLWQTNIWPEQNFSLFIKNLVSWSREQGKQALTEVQRNYLLYSLSLGLRAKWHRIFLLRNKIPTGSTFFICNALSPNLIISCFHTVFRALPKPKKDSSFQAKIFHDIVRYLSPSDRILIVLSLLVSCKCWPLLLSCH